MERQIHAIVDSYGYPVYFMISEGQRNEINYAIPLLNHIRMDRSKVLAERWYDSNQLMDYIYEHGGEPPFHLAEELKLNVVAIGGFTKKDSWLIKAFWRIATCYDKLALMTYK